MALVSVKSYKGTIIYVDPATGRFSATVQHDKIVTKELSAIERTIDDSIPAVTTWEGLDLMRLRAPDGYYFDAGDIVPAEVVKITGIQRSVEGRGKNARTVINYLAPEGGYVYQHNAFYQRDDAVIAEIAEMVAEAKALVERYKALADRLVPVTREQIIAAADAAGTVKSA